MTRRPFWTVGAIGSKHTKARPGEGGALYYVSLFQLPNILIVLLNGAVGGEVAGLGDVDQHLLGPGPAVSVGVQAALLGGGGIPPTLPGGQKGLTPLLPAGNDRAEVFARLMELAHEILNHHPAAEKRRQAGKMPANGVWFWAEGSAVALDSFWDKYHKTGAVISAVPSALATATQKVSTCSTATVSGSLEVTV